MIETLRLIDSSFRLYPTRFDTTHESRTPLIFEMRVDEQHDSSQILTGARYTVKVKPKRQEAGDSGSDEMPIMEGGVEYTFTTSQDTSDEYVLDSLWLIARVHIRQMFNLFEMTAPPLPKCRPSRKNNHGNNQ